MNREAKIGLFVLVALVVVGYFVVRTSDVSALWGGKEPKRILEVQIDDASGLRKGTDVRVFGVKVGEITDLRLETQGAVAVLSVRESLVLHRDAKAELRNLGVLGERFISISPGSSGEWSAGEQLHANSPAGLEDVTSTIQAIGEDLKIITSNLRASTQTPMGGNRLDLIAANIEALTQVLVEMVKENRGNVKTTTSEIASLTGNLNRNIPELVAQMTDLVKELRAVASDNRGNLNETLKNVASISGKFDQTSDSLASIARKVDEGKGTIGKLINDPETNQNLNKVLVKAEESLGEIQKFLNQSNRLQLELNFDTQYIARFSTSKNAFGVTLRPSANKYYRLEGVSRGDEYLLETTNVVRDENTYDANGNLISHTVVSERKKDKDVALTGLIAYRFNDIFVRGGLFEGEGGAGVEYMPENKPYILRFEGYDFSRANNLAAHGRFDVSVKGGKSVNLHVGWDDLFEPSRGSFYIGGGISWKDDDLKVLLLQAGSLFK